MPDQMRASSAAADSAASVRAEMRRPSWAAKLGVPAVQLSPSQQSLPMLSTPHSPKGMPATQPSVPVLGTPNSPKGMPAVLLAPNAPHGPKGTPESQSPPSQQTLPSFGSHPSPKGLVGAERHPHLQSLPGPDIQGSVKQDMHRLQQPGAQHTMPGSSPASPSSLSMPAESLSPRQPSGDAPSAAAAAGALPPTGRSAFSSPDGAPDGDDFSSRPWVPAGILQTRGSSTASIER